MAVSGMLTILVTFISIGNDLHHILTQATAYVKDMEAVSAEKGKLWSRRPTALMQICRLMRAANA